MADEEDYREVNIAGRGVRRFPAHFTDEQVAAAIDNDMPSRASEAVSAVKDAIPDSGKANVTDFIRWLNTRAGDAVSMIAGAPAATADMNQAMITKAGEFFGLDPHASLAIAKMVNHTVNPIGAGMQNLPRAEDVRKQIDTSVGATPQNAPESWGPAGKMIDAGTSAAMTAPIAPGSAARNLLPAIAGGVTSEGAGEYFKGTPLETPARFIGGLLGGVGTGAAQNVAGSSARGASNVLMADQRNAQQQAARILGRAVNEDATTMPALQAAHAEYLPGTPLAATAGPNVRGAVRGAYTMRGPARDVVEGGANQFIEGAPSRVEPLISQNVSALAPADVRAMQLRQQGGADARPLYQASGANDPQAILTQSPGAPIVTPSSILGADAQPILTTRPGAPVTTVSTPNPVLQSPQLRELIQDSGHIQDAIRQARRLPSFRNMPEMSQPMLDKVYKYLGDLQSSAQNDRTGTKAFDIGNIQRQFRDLVAAENPTWGRALEAYAAPQALADAAELGHRLAGSNMSAELFGRTFRDLPPAQQHEFMGGVATFIRGKGGSTDRATTAERVWNNQNFRDKMAQLPVIADAGPSSVYQQLNAPMQGEREAARNLRDITKGSQTNRIAHDVSDVAGGDTVGLVQSILSRGIGGATLTHALERISAVSARASEGRTQAVNEALARMGMETDPAAIQRTHGLVEAARHAAEQTERNRRRVYGAGALTGLLGGL